MLEQITHMLIRVSPTHTQSVVMSIEECAIYLEARKHPDDPDSKCIVEQVLAPLRKCIQPGDDVAVCIEPLTADDYDELQEAFRI